MIVCPCQGTLYSFLMDFFYRHAKEIDLNKIGIEQNEQEEDELMALWILTLYKHR